MDFDRFLVREVKLFLKRRLRGYRVTCPRMDLTTSARCSAIALRGEWVQVFKMVQWSRVLIRSRVTYCQPLDAVVTVCGGELCVRLMIPPPGLRVSPDVFTVPLDVPDAFERVVQYIRSFERVDEHAPLFSE